MTDRPRKPRESPPRRFRLSMLLALLVLPEWVALQDFVLPLLGWWPTLVLLAGLQVPMLVEVRGIAAHRSATPLELAGWQLFYAAWTGALFYATLAGPVRVAVWLATGELELAGEVPPWWLGGFPFAASAFGVFVGQHVYPRRRVTLALAGLPPSWSGLRVVQLSDIHTGRFITERRLRRLARLAARASPDLVVVTGDIVDTNAAFAPLAARVLASLPAPQGVFAVLGNHDHYAGGAAVQRALTEAGVRVLVNEGVVLRRGEEALYLAGVDDLWHGANLAAALASCPPGATTLLLSHQPGVFPAAAARGVALTLAGHTHGGQVAVPFWRAFSLARLITRYVSGVYRAGDSYLYVNNGAGVIRPLVRIGARAEVAEITLVSAPG